MIGKTATLIILMLAMACSVSGQNLHHLQKDLPCVNKNFNVYVHIALDELGLTNYTEDDLNAAIALTNQHFAPICMSFSVCAFDTIINYNFDSLAQQAEIAEVRTLFAEHNRLNIYIVEELDNPTVCGYGGSDIFLKKGCGPFTLVHEMGHVFGLLHTFEGHGEELVDGSNCETAGDGICDTPADPYDPDMVEPDGRPYSRGCEFIYPETDANGQFYQPDMGNIMSYYGCSCGFTRGQYLRMVETYKNGKNRLW